jgi:hypothetical protein
VYARVYKLVSYLHASDDLLPSCLFFSYWRQNFDRSVYASCMALVVVVVGHPDRLRGSSYIAKSLIYVLGSYVDTDDKFQDCFDTFSEFEDHSRHSR